MKEPDFKTEGKALIEALGLGTEEASGNRGTVAMLVLKVMWERGVTAGMTKVTEKLSRMSEEILASYRGAIPDSLKLPYEPPTLTPMGNLKDHPEIAKLIEDVKKIQE